jgi:class 3 adenylate cyclase
MLDAHMCGRCSSGEFTTEQSSDIFTVNTVVSVGRVRPVQRIADWLEKLRMSEYAQRFAENGITVAALPHVTDQDLKDIGVLLGHRRIMLAAISKLAGAVSAASEPSRPQFEPKPQETAERRQVTVMFSDLVGSTALSARMDPEDLREIISAYQKCVAETVLRFGGFVAKYMGDGVLVYFGYPHAHEDEAERAVRAGLELIVAVGRLKPSTPLQTRVGIATGLGVVGDLIGSGESQERGIIGETPNVAARLQGAAEPNTVVIAENTRKLLGNLFDLHDLGAQELKGIRGPSTRRSGSPQFLPSCRNCSPTKKHRGLLYVDAGQALHRREPTCLGRWGSTPCGDNAAAANTAPAKCAPRAGRFEKISTAF